MVSHLPELPEGHTPAPGAMLRVDVRGKSQELWAGLRSKLMAKVQEVLNSTLDHKRGTTVREEAREFTAALLDFAKAKLQMPVVEVEKAAAEVAKLYAERQKELAEADKIHAEADAIRLETNIRELTLTLALTKAMLVGEPGEEAVLLGRQVDAFLEAVRDLSRFELPQ
jgi:hypothetical protein